MKRSFKTLLVVSVAALSMAARAQEMAPPAELDALAWQVGNWEGDVKWTIPGMEAMDAKMTWSTVRDGMFYKQVMTTDMMGMKVTETAFMGWDAGKKKYSCYTFTSMAPTPRIEWGTMEGDKAVFLSEPWTVGPETMESRATVGKKSATEMTFLLEIKAGTAWTKMAEGTFKKKS